MAKYRRSPGFTLIELLLVVAIISILAAIALPSYLEMIRKSHRADAINALETIQLEQAKFRANCPHYAKLMDSDPANVVCNAAASTSKFLVSDTKSPNGYYTLSMDLAPSDTVYITSFTALATATGAQTKDTDCLQYAITESGPDTSAGYADDDCWKR